MLNKIVDEYKKLKSIVKTNTFSLIDTKKLVTIVIRTIDNDYLCFYENDFIEFDYEDKTVYIHNINGYNKPIKDEIIKKITILWGDYMKIELSTGEIWDLLKEGSTNQRNFIQSLKYTEFEEFLEFIEDYYDDEFDLRGYLNGGVLWVEEDPVEDYIVWRNDRITICWI